MSTNRSFQAMLNEYLAIDLLKEEMVKRTYLLQKVDKDDGWKGGKLPVPFRGARASSIQFGGLTADAKVVQSNFVRGHVDDYQEVWGTLKFNQRDLMEHDGKINEKSFLKILPDEIDDYLEYMKAVCSLNMLTGKQFAKATVDGTNLGVLGVSNVERVELGMLAILAGDVAPEIEVWVTNVTVDTDKITVSATMGGAPLDISAYTVADNAKLYYPGTQPSLGGGFTSLKTALLSAANGGSASLYSVSKTSSPYLQAVNIDGSGISASNILVKLFDAFTRYRKVGKGNANELLMSYKHFGSILKLTDTQKGPFNVVAGSQKASLYGWDEIEIMGVRGKLKIVAIQEMDDDVIIGMDWKALKFYSNGMFKKRTAPDGKQYYEVRATTGYYYLLDISLFGELVLERPSYCFIVYNIPNY
jgi:hypothetical protein